MRNFIYTIIIFAICSIVLAFGLDVIITKGLHKYTDYVNEVWNDVRNETVTPDVLILGSCSAHYDCNPQKIDSILKCNSYVCAMSNLTFPCHNFMWEMYKQYKTSLPKIIIVVLDYGDLDFRDVKTSQEDKQFLPLVDEQIARKFLLKYGGYNWVDIYVPLYRYYGHHDMIIHGIMNFFNINKYSGERAHYKGFISLDEPYNFHKEWYGEHNVVKIQPEIVQMFQNFLDDCSDRNIKVILAISPLGHELETIIDNVDDIYNIYEQLALSHNCQFVSFTNNEFSHNVNNFESPNHLNAKAADSFSINLAQYIDSLKIY